MRKIRLFINLSHDNPSGRVGNLKPNLVGFAGHIGKYEREEAIPSADVLNRIAKDLEVSTDYILNGSLQDKAKNTIKDDELLLQFKKVELLPADKKRLVKEFLDAFLFKDSVQQQFKK